MAQFEYQFNAENLEPAMSEAIQKALIFGTSNIRVIYRDGTLHFESLPPGEVFVPDLLS